MIRPALLLLAGVLGAAPGCGLIDPDIADFDLSLPEKEFTMDTSQWGLSSGSFPEIACSADADACAAATADLCESSHCAGACDTATSQCKAMVQVALSQEINLLSEKPELETINNQPLVSVTIDRVEYQVVENTLNFESPPLVLYVAPVNVMTPSSAEAQAVGTIAAIPAGRQLDWGPVELTPEGEAVLREFMGNYRSLFNIIVAADVDIESGMAMPEGRAVARIRVKAHAGL